MMYYYSILNSRCVETVSIELFVHKFYVSNVMHFLLAIYIATGNMLIIIPPQPVESKLLYSFYLVS